MKQRRFGSTLAVICVLLSVGTVSPNNAWANHAVTVVHIPPAPSPAGDALTLSIEWVSDCTLSCSDVTLTAHVSDAWGNPKTVSKSSYGTGTNMAQGSLSVIVPGEFIRYPGFSYWLQFSQVSCWLDCWSGGHTTTKRVPGSGTHSVSVFPELRLRFKNSSGTPLSNKVIHWFPLFDASVAWTVTTSTAGEATFRLPLTDSKVLQAIAAPSRKHMSVAIQVIDQWPQDLQPPESSPPSGERRTVNAAFLRTTFNLGYAGLPALTGEIQDSEVKLSSASLDFQTVIPDPGGPTHGYDLIEEWADMVKAAKNVGGDRDFKSEFWYRHSVNSTFTTQMNAGDGWQVSGEITSFENKANEAGPWTVDSSIGRRNVDALVEYKFGLWRGFACGYTGNGTCYRWHEVKPLYWTTGTDTSGEYNSLHGTATAPPNTSDCTVRSEVAHMTEHEKGNRISVTLGGSSVFASIPMGVRTKYTSESAALVRHKWSIVGNAFPYHHRFVSLGLAVEGESLCPRTHPGMTYTDSANVNKSHTG